MRNKEEVTGERLEKMRRQRGKSQSSVQNRSWQAEKPSQDINTTMLCINRNIEWAVNYSFNPLRSNHTLTDTSLPFSAVQKFEPPLISYVVLPRSQASCPFVFKEVSRMTKRPLKLFFGNFLLFHVFSVHSLNLSRFNRIKHEKAPNSKAEPVLCLQIPHDKIIWIA